MGRRDVWAVIAAVLISVLFAAVTTAGGVDLWTEPDWEATPTPSQPSDAVPAESEAAFEPIVDDGRPPPQFPDWLRAILSVLLVATLTAVSIVIAVWAWRNRPRLRWRRRSAEPAFDVLPDVAAAIVDEAAAQRAALLSGEPRNAIVRCWLRLEDDVAAVGLRRDPADTSVEFTERVLARYTVDSEAINELSALYREARFSDHRIDEAARGAALAALDRLHRALAASTAERSDTDVEVAT